MTSTGHFPEKIFWHHCGHLFWHPGQFTILRNFWLKFSKWKISRIFSHKVSYDVHKSAILHVNVSTVIVALLEDFSTLLDWVSVYRLWYWNVWCSPQCFHVIQGTFRQELFPHKFQIMNTTRLKTIFGYYGAQNTQNFRHVRHLIFW